MAKKNTPISLKAVHLVRSALDNIQWYSSSFMMLNSLSSDLGTGVATMCHSVQNQILQTTGLTPTLAKFPELKWHKFTEYRGNFKDLKNSGVTLYENFGKNLQKTPLDFLEAAAKTGTLGFVEYYTTGGHVSLSIPIALLTSGSVSAENIALPLVAMHMTDQCLDWAEDYLTPKQDLELAA